MNLQAFIDTEKILTTEEDMREFFAEELGIEFCFDVLPAALFIYDESYYIEQLPDGRFQVGAGDEDAIRGTLPEMQEVLYDYVRENLAEMDRAAADEL